MAITRIKRGATFSMVIEMTQEEWDALSPQSAVAGFKGQRTERITINVQMDADNRQLSVFAPTQNWEPRMFLDVKVTTTTGNVVYIPPGDHIQIHVESPIAE